MHLWYSMFYSSICLIAGIRGIPPKASLWHINSCWNSSVWISFLSSCPIFECSVIFNIMTTLPLLYSKINLAPFLPHIEHCFANLIFYEPLDFTSLEFPISVSTPRHVYYPNESSCDAMNTLFTTENEPGFGICPRIKNNFHIKQVTCLAVALNGKRRESNWWRHLVH